MSLWSLTGPALHTVMTRNVSSSEQGQLQGVVNSVRSVAALIGPTLFTFIFAAAIAKGVGWHFPGAPFLAASLLLLASQALALKATRGTHDGS